MKFSEYIQKQGDEFRGAGDSYEALGYHSKSCIDHAVQRYIDEHATKQQCVAFANYLKEISIGELIRYNTQQHYQNFIKSINK